MKTERINRALAKIIKEASYLREKSDYDDFYIASKEETEKQIANAEEFIRNAVEFMNNMDIGIVSKTDEMI